MLELSNAGMEKRYWQSCYHSSTDAPADFWKNCENKGPTVTIVRYQDYIFAAFSDRDWGDQGTKNVKDLPAPLRIKLLPNLRYQPVRNSPEAR